MASQTVKSWDEFLEQKQSDVAGYNLHTENDDDYSHG